MAEWLLRQFGRLVPVKDCWFESNFFRSLRACCASSVGSHWRSQSNAVWLRQFTAMPSRAGAECEAWGFAFGEAKPLRGAPPSIHPRSGEAVLCFAGKATRRAEYGYKKENLFILNLLLIGEAKAPRSGVLCFADDALKLINKNKLI